MFWFKKDAGVGWLVVFLGNPGPRYAGTRHNVGFMAADIAARQAGVKIDRVKFHALTATGDLGGNRVLLMKPQTYMNLSGTAVHEAMAFYKLALDRLIVVSDDVALPVGKLRIRTHGSAGGHNGLKDIMAKCGGDAFVRVRIGVGAPPHPDYDMADWVLGTFQNQDADTIEKACSTAVDAIACIVSDGPDRAMNLYN